MVCEACCRSRCLAVLKFVVCEWRKGVGISWAVAWFVKVLKFGSKCVLKFVLKFWAVKVCVLFGLVGLGKVLKFVVRCV